jgi:predicted nucleic acid-binding protein
MTRYAIDAEVAIRLIRDGSDADQRHQLVGPSVLRSQALSLLFRDVRAGRLSEADGRRQLERLAAMKIRLLGDRVSRATAWKLADRLGWDDIGPAEYLAVATLQADALVTDDEALASAAAGIVGVVSYDALTR